MSRTSKADNSLFQLTRPSRCYNCDKQQATGDIVQLRDSHCHDEREVLCLSCAGLDTFVRVPAGNVKMTRLAKKHSAQHYVILKWSELWKCYERQGLLVERQAAERAQQELGTEDARTSPISD